MVSSMVRDWDVRKEVDDCFHPAPDDRFGGGDQLHRGRLRGGHESTLSSPRLSPSLSCQGMGAMSCKHDLPMAPRARIRPRTYPLSVRALVQSHRAPSHRGVHYESNGNRQILYETCFNLKLSGNEVTQYDIY